MLTPTKTKYTNLKLSRECHRLAKAAAYLQGMEFYRYVEEAVWDRIKRDKKSGKVRLDGPTAA